MITSQGVSDVKPNYPQGASLVARDKRTTSPSRGEHQTNVKETVLLASTALAPSDIILTSPMRRYFRSTASPTGSKIRKISSCLTPLLNLGLFVLAFITEDRRRRQRYDFGSVWLASTVSNCPLHRQGIALRCLVSAVSPYPKSSPKTCKYGGFDQLPCSNDRMWIS